MRWLQITFIALVLGLFVSGPAESRTTVRRVTRVDPVTGVRTTEVIKIKERGWNRGRHLGWRNRHVYRSNVLGAPIAVGRGFPRRPFDGQRVWRAGRLWEFDRPLGRWFIVR